MYVIFMLLVFFAGVAAAAPAPRLIEPGARIRIDSRTTSPGRNSGLLLRFTADRISIRPDRADTAMVMARTQVQTLWVSRGREHHVMSRAVKGAIAGAAVGMLLGGPSADSYDVFWALVGGGGVGFLVGSVNAIAHKTDVWTRVPPESWPAPGTP